MFGSYLLGRGRAEEVIALVKAAYASALPSDQPLLINLWGNALTNLGRNPEALEKYRATIALKPDFWIGWNNVLNVYAVMGNEEAVIQTGEEMERLARRRRCFAAEMPEVYWQNLDQTRWDLLAVHAVKGDIESDPLEHWGQAHERLGEHTKAKEKYRIALGLDLSDADRRLLQGYCG